MYPGPAVWHKPCTKITMSDLQGAPSANPRHPERPFECDWHRYPPLPGRGPNPSGCKGSYINELDYNRHIWGVHIRPTEVQCGVCKVWFANNTELNIHKKGKKQCATFVEEKNERARRGEVNPPGYHWRNCDHKPRSRRDQKGFTNVRNENVRKGGAK